MSNTTTKFAIALFLVLATSAASFARGGGGPAAAGHSGSGQRVQEGAEQPVPQSAQRPVCWSTRAGSEMLPR